MCQAAPTFGRKAVADAGIEAARLARGIGQPVRVNWTRQEEFQRDLPFTAERVQSARQDLTTSKGEERTSQ